MLPVGRSSGQGKGAGLPHRSAGRVLVMRTVVDVPLWRLRARVEEGHACDLGEFDLFFGVEDETPDQRRYRERTAARVCAGCPVAAECLELAIRNREHYGVWGGLSEDELRQEIRARAVAARREGAA